VRSCHLSIAASSTVQLLVEVSFQD